MKITINKKQLDELNALAYWTADNSYCIEKMQREEYEREERARHKDTIELIFRHLDRLNTPHFIQNAVIFWAEDWRRTCKEYMLQGLARKGYEVTVI